MVDISFIKSADICSYTFLYATYVTDSKFVIEMMKVFDKFSFFSGLRSNLVLVKI